MSSSVSINRVSHPRYKFRVFYPETLPDGSTVRRPAFFRARAEADAFAKAKEIEVTNHGTRHGTVEDDERAALIKYRTWAAGRKDAPSLSTLMEKAIAAFEAARPPLTVAEAIIARLEAVDRRKLSARHQQDLKNRLQRFAADFGKQQIADVTLADVERWLHRLDVSAGTFRNYAKVLASVFRHAVKRGYLTTSPLIGLDKPKVTRKPPAILTPAQLRNLLDAAAPELVPLLVVQAFCGIRRAEANRLEWRHIHTEGAAPYVELPSSVTKTNRRRICEIPPCAAAWLKPLSGMPADPLTVTETIYRDRLIAAASAARIEWSENLLRHSFGTYKLAATQNAPAVALAMGNSPAVVLEHYANVCSPEAAAAWWQVFPVTPAAMVPFKKARSVS